MEREIGDVGLRGLDTTTPNSFYSKFTNVTRAMRTSPPPVYMTRMRSLHTGTRQRCACVFLVILFSMMVGELHGSM